jgi:hypothetical protein
MAYSFKRTAKKVCAYPLFYFKLHFINPSPSPPPLLPECPKTATDGVFLESSQKDGGFNEVYLSNDSGSGLKVTIVHKRRKIRKRKTQYTFHKSISSNKILINYIYLYNKLILTLRVFRLAKYLSAIIYFRRTKCSSELKVQ